MLTSVQRVVIGGGILNRKCLLPKIHLAFIQKMNGYVQHPFLSTVEGGSDYIVESGFENNSTLAALLLGLQG